MDYLLDTSLVSAIIKQDKSVMKKMKERIDKGERFFISVITDYEILRGLFAVNAIKKQEIYEILRSQLNVLWIDELELSKKAAEVHVTLKQRGQIIQDADILIAATALVKNLTVITGDSHFSRIETLKVENWSKKSNSH